MKQADAKRNKTAPATAQTASQRERLNPLANRANPVPAGTPEQSYIAIPRSMGAGPNSFAATLEGDCLAPLYCDRDQIIVDPDQMPDVGDIVAIMWRDLARQPLVKRLAESLPDKSLWNLGGEVEGLLVVEMLNPPRELEFGLRSIAAVHKVIGRVPGAREVPA